MRVETRRELVRIDVRDDPDAVASTEAEGAVQLAVLDQIDAGGLDGIEAAAAVEQEYFAPLEDVDDVDRELAVASDIRAKRGELVRADRRIFASGGVDRQHSAPGFAGAIGGLRFEEGVAITGLHSYATRLLLRAAEIKTARPFAGAAPFYFGLRGVAGSGRGRRFRGAGAFIFARGSDATCRLMDFRR